MDTKKQIKATLGDLVMAEPALNRLMTRTLPFKAAYHLSKLGRLVHAETAIAKEQQEAWIKELGEERDITEEEKARGLAGPIIEVKLESREEYTTRLKELKAQEVVLEWGPINFEIPEITAADLEALGALVGEVGE